MCQVRARVDLNGHGNSDRVLYKENSCLQLDFIGLIQVSRKMRANLNLNTLAVNRTARAHVARIQDVRKRNLRLFYEPFWLAVHRVRCRPAADLGKPPSPC